MNMQTTNNMTTATNYISSSGIQTMELTQDSLFERQKHEDVLLDLEAKKRAFRIDVPTLPQDVRSALRNLCLPVRFFGENLANVRDRLRMELAKQQVLNEGGINIEEGGRVKQEYSMAKDEDEVTKYTRASQELFKAREEIAKFSLERSKKRLEHERILRSGGKKKRNRLLVEEEEEKKSKDDDEIEVCQLDERCTKLYKSIRAMGLEGSQYGDNRALSAIRTFKYNQSLSFAATGSWSGTIKLWDVTTSAMENICSVENAHDDRIMGIDVFSSGNTALCATASIDLTGKIWKVQQDDDVTMTDCNDNDDNNDNNNDNVTSKYSLTEMGVLRGHQARLCKIAFHPMDGRYVATTSFDHTWRLWDIGESSCRQLLLQDGHAKEVYGIDFHPDGSLVTTTDFAGVTQLWDLRTGKSIANHHKTHAKRVLCAAFNPTNGYHLMTAGDDGTIKIYDLRQRKILATVPAHSRLISQLSLDREEGEYLASSSFDGTAKVWSTRDWRLLATLKGHQGLVMGVDLILNKDDDDVGIITSGYDKTIKLWK